MKISFGTLTLVQFDAVLALLPRRVSAVFYQIATNQAGSIGLYYGGDESVLVAAQDCRVTPTDVLARFPDAIEAFPSLA